MQISNGFLFQYQTITEFVLILLQLSHSHCRMLKKIAVVEFDYTCNTNHLSVFQVQVVYASVIKDAVQTALVDFCQ